MSVYRTPASDVFRRKGFGFSGCDNNRASVSRFVAIIEPAFRGLWRESGQRPVRTARHIPAAGRHLETGVPRRTPGSAPEEEAETAAGAGSSAEESALPAADGFALQLDEIPNVEPMRFWVTVRNRFENDPGEIAEGHFCVEDGVLVVTDSMSGSSAARPCGRVRMLRTGRGICC